MGHPNATEPDSSENPSPSGWDELSGRLTAVEAALREGDRRAVHRETVIDRLHEENRELRTGVHRQLLEPVVSDLVRLYDGLVRESGRFAADPEAAQAAALLASFADDVELALDRCGVEVVAAVVGEPFRAGGHAAVGTEACTESRLDGTVAVPVGAGLRDRATGRMRRLPKARFFRFEGGTTDDRRRDLDVDAATDR
ncbi:MAG: hypothetical protein AVDCRST_MAG66-4605 [uncultured Pseudonocardia sp.]|uniref:Nucleotide exchange factor GrpE n=1 Tax=uncultured Pseudonocardia sp. TaxID=211455 RepID=A0A6J4QIX7_9PSEU|nr:MAG: hypothetical protein AVDCRST_MAG66-4605 [uncultured Pseudonocardia sp.]